MLLAITGIQTVDFDDVHGVKVYGVVKDNQVESVIGEPTASVWFPKDGKAQLPPDTFAGSLVEIFFEQGKRTPAFCREYDGE